MKKFLSVLIVFLLVSEFLAIGGVKAITSDDVPIPVNPCAYSDGTTIYVKWNYACPAGCMCYVEIYEYKGSDVWEYKKTVPASDMSTSFSGQSHGKHRYKLCTKLRCGSNTTFSRYTDPLDAYVLHQPTGLTVSVNPDILFIEGNPYLTLKWNTVDSNATNVKILRKDPNNLRIIATLASSSVTFTDTTVLPNKTYTYWIYATRKDDTHITDDSSSISPPVSKLTLPAAPTNFQAYGIDKTVYMSWSHTKDCDGYKIYKWVKSGFIFNWSLVTTLNKDTLSYHTTVADYGAYSFKVTAYNASGDSARSPTKDAYALKTPTGLTATPLSSTSIKLTWDTLDTNAKQVRVSYSTDGTVYNSLGVFNIPVSYVTVSSLTPNTQYWFRIAVKRDSNESNYSDPVTAKTLPAGTAPAKPYGFGGVALTCNKVDLVWIDGSDNENGFKIERKEGAGVYAEIGSVPANTISYSDTTVSTGKTYYYRVRAYNAYGNSDYTVEINITIPGCDSDIYSTGMITVGGTMLCDLDLGKQVNHIDPSNDFLWEQVTDVERYISPKNGAMFHVVGNVDFDSIMHSGLKTYSYSSDKINASDNASNQIPAGTVVATITDAGRYSKFRIEVYGYDLVIKFVTYKENPPNAPSNLTATATSCTNVNLTWTDNADNETGFKIERKESGGTYTEIATVTANTTSYSDTTAQAQKAYYYRVVAYNSFGNSSYTNEANVATPACGSVPSKPTNLFASAISPSGINLSWSDNSDNEDGFKIERKVLGGTYAEVKTLPANTTIFLDSGLAPNTTYYYRVRAYNSAGNSDYSNEANATTMKATETIIIRLYIDKTSYYVNDVKKELDAAPIIRESRTLLPIRAVIEALGGTIEWDANEQKVTINFKETTIELWIGKNTALVNGEYKLIDPKNPKVTPIIIPPGRTMLPIRFIAENLGCKVDWNNTLREVKITYPAP